MHTLKQLKVGIFSILAFSSTAICHAELKPISDTEMSNVTGQAFFSVDNYDYEGTDFMRVNLGLDIETLLDIGELEVGRYHRWENGDACYDCDGTEPGLEKHAADLMLQNFSLGQINEDTGEIEPFFLKDPYLEFALDDNGTPIGVRLGFANAKGWLSGNIESLTGNIDIQIKDTAWGLAQMEPDCSSGVYDCLLGYLLKILGGPILQDAPLEAKANLVNEAGELDPVRANLVGLPNGKVFKADGTGEINVIESVLLDIIIAATPRKDAADGGGALAWREGDVIFFEGYQCEILSVPVCFDFTNFGSFEIGRGTEEGTPGLFLSVQTAEQIKWAQTFESDPGSAVTSFQETGFGTFFNIPNNGVQVTLQEAMDGIDRHRTHFINRGMGLF